MVSPRSRSWWARPASARPACSASWSARVPARVQVLAGQAEPGSLGRPFELALDALGLDAVPEATDRLAAVVQAYLDRVGSGPALVIFEDLHWADAESLGVFERLASGTPPGTLLVGSYRSDELSRMLPCGRSARAPRSSPHRASPLARPADPAGGRALPRVACTGGRCPRGRRRRALRPHRRQPVLPRGDPERGRRRRPRVPRDAAACRSRSRRSSVASSTA